ncbi:MAG: hypothetical protein GY895_03400 [Phycisphaera sp.]|nr:hypothetical protein [Phycisphaera sp.]
MRFEVQRWERGAWCHECYTKTEDVGRKRGHQIRNLGHRWRMRCLSVRPTSSSHADRPRSRPRTRNRSEGGSNGLRSRSVTGYDRTRPVNAPDAGSAYEQSEAEIELVEIIAARCEATGRAKPAGLAEMAEPALLEWLERLTTIAGSDDDESNEAR